VKLFVGQIPRTYEDEQLNQLIGQYGEVLETFVHRDKVTKEHKGCAFVTVRSRDAADAAIAALKDQKPPGFSGPMVIRYADGESDRMGREPSS
jgi:CUG-BP- and ETR3-like factor